ncbi:MAG TPA: hemerythrin domain-containing protein [Rhodanobacteraceae bacterium]|nr:hemerythrin domain-containing protein [Rhodanobacteraceae bacterium]
MSDERDANVGWPAELTFLLERHPRSTWPTARSASVAFWLDVHERLRRDAAGLVAAGDDYRGGRSSPAQLAVIAAPRLRGLVAATQGHHQIEDFSYFPEFRRAEPRLAAGFDRLEREHAGLNRNIDAALAALAELRSAAEHAPVPASSSSLKLAAQRYVEAAAILSAELLRHLHDEENLVVPLLLEHGDY